MLASSSVSAGVSRPSVSLRCARRTGTCAAHARTRARPVHASGRRSFTAVRAGDGEEASDEDAPSSGGPMYMDDPEAELELKRKRQVSDSMKEKLRAESLGLGGDPNNPLPSNYFANIILGVSVLVLLTVLFTGM